MEHDVESHTEGQYVEDVPEKEEGECLENIEEHGDVHVVPGQAGVPGCEGDQLGPGEKEADPGQLSLQLVPLLVRRKQEEADQTHHGHLHPVLQGEDVPSEADRHLEYFSAG